tara:strand:+ start:10401 stop:11480 length:1080 start_codon:yes stop_codon:yes gene_type:complete
MISSIRISGFKRFRDFKFALKPLTVLAGMNGSGKTSVIHSLLLAREAWKRNDGIVELNGPFGLELGSFEDVLNKDTSDQFSVSLQVGETSVEDWEFSKGDAELFAQVAQAEPSASRAFNKVGRSFQYLCAERWGPRITQSSTPQPIDRLEVGCYGEFCAQVFDTLASFKVEPARQSKVHAGEVALLRRQTELWLGILTRPLQINTEKFSDTGITALTFRTDETWSKPTNMGFGVTYSLPVVLAGLTATDGGILIIENPEAHLHPAGQSHMGVFLATIAAAGVHVIVETHSDHVLNGIRRAIGEKNCLTSEDAIVHFFDGESPNPSTLHFTESGSMSAWPAGFFDQFQIDVRAITSVRRN